MLAMEPKIGPEKPKAIDHSKTMTHDKLAARDQADHHLATRVESMMGFFTPARRLLQWGELQHAKHAEWQDLFYDLILVAFAFQGGNFLKGVSGANLLVYEGIIGLFALGVTTISGWSTLMRYRARFEGNSPFHQSLNAIEGLLFAAAQHNIVPDLVQFEKVNRWAYLSFTLACRVLALVRAINKLSYRIVLTRKAATRDMWWLFIEITCLALTFATPGLLSYFGVLIGTWLVQLLLIYVPAIKKWGLDRSAMVPMHIEFTMARMGELVMLMLGEGVLSLVISTSVVKLETLKVCVCVCAYALTCKRSEAGYLYPASDSIYTEGSYCGSYCFLGLTKYAVSFVSGFLLLTSIMFLYYRSNPTGHGQRHHHAMRRDSIRGIIWNAAHSPLCIGLIAIGVAIKSIHPYAAKAVPGEYVILIAVASTLTLPTIAVQQLMHPGIVGHFYAPGRVVRVGLWLGKLVASYAMLAMLYFPSSTEGYLYLLFANLLTFAMAICVTLEKAPAREKLLWDYIDSLDGLPTAPKIR
ncbi:hypothetical protein T492DRAFT_1004246 [Pavlovales sp. CCMP2436]|nr:hypothetical protein T492DRAFT_1004246 [Pavlovales sp. CCMP2436]